MNKYTNREIAESWELWCGYCDPGAKMSEREFDEMDMQERLELLAACFGKEMTGV